MQILRYGSDNMATTLTFDIDVAKRDLQQLVTASPTEFNAETELKGLKEISDGHNSFLGGTISSVGQILNNINEQNAEYSNYKEALAAAIAAAEEAEREGDVPPGGTNPPGSTGPTNPGGGGGGGDTGGSTNENPDNNFVPFVPTTVEPVEPFDPTPTMTDEEPIEDPTLDPTPTVSEEEPIEDPTFNPTKNPTENPTENPTGLNPTATPTENNPTETPTGGNSQGVNPMLGTALNPNNPFGNNEVGQETLSNLSPQEQDAIRNKLQEMGYTENEINQILSGGVSAPQVLVDALQSELENNYSEELRKELVNKYGFDIFNEDGTVDKDKLALALVMDNKNSIDEYSMIELLHNKGIDIIGTEMYDTVANRLGELITQYPDLRDKLLAKYGFDIFNSDGTVNRDNLTLALLMDMEDTADDFDLLGFLADNFPDAVKDLSNNVPAYYAKGKSKNNNVVTTVAGVGLLGATAGGLAFLAKKKKEAEEAELKELEEESTEEEELMDTESDKEWLYGLGLGLAAKRDDSDTENKVNKESPDSQDTNI
jgi:hypothetical protein